MKWWFTFTCQEEQRSGVNYFLISLCTNILVYDVYTLLQRFIGPDLGENYTRIAQSYKTVMRAHTGSLTGPATHLCNVIPVAFHTFVNCVVRMAVLTLCLVCMFFPTNQILAQGVLLCDSSLQQPRRCCPVKSTLPALLQ